MLISQLCATLQAIFNEYGDIDVEIHYDKNQFEGIKNDPQDIYTDTIKTIKIKPDNKGVYLTNDFSYIDVYNGCRCEVLYNPEKKLYEGKIIPPELIEGFNATFTTPNKYEISNIFKSTVDEYNDFLANAKITKTYEKVNNILKDQNLEFDEDYGELTGPELEEDNDIESSDGDYGEI